MYRTHTHTCADGVCVCVCAYLHETFAIKTNAKQYLFASCCRYELDVVPIDCNRKFLLAQLATAAGGVGGAAAAAAHLLDDTQGARLAEEVGTLYIRATHGALPRVGVASVQHAPVIEEHNAARLQLELPLLLLVAHQLQ